MRLLPSATQHWSGAVWARLLSTLMLAAITTALIVDGAPLLVLVVPLAVTTVNAVLLVARIRFEGRRRSEPEAGSGIRR